MSELVKKENQNLAEVAADAFGFEDTRSEDIVIPRIKVINALSPERVDGEASEGDVLNSLTKTNVTGQRFIPIRQFYNHIKWNPDRDAEERILCRSADGKIGQDENGSIACATCRQYLFDNSKQGKESYPKCTAYINFLGYFAEDKMPVVLSFGKTNYNEGKKLLSIARSMRSSIWSYAYTIASKKITKDRNSWYIITAQMAGPTTEEDRAFANELFASLKDFTTEAYEEPFSDSVPETDAEIAAEI